MIPLLLEAVEASGYYCFENWLIKLKFPHLLKTLGTMIQDNYQTFLPLIAIYFSMFQYEKTCINCLYQTFKWYFLAYFLKDFEINNLILIHVNYWNLDFFKLSNNFILIFLLCIRMKIILSLSDLLR